MQLPRASTGKRKRSRPGSHGNQSRGGALATRQPRNWKNQQHEKREPKRRRAAYSHQASLPAASLMAVMPKKTKVTQFDTRAMCPQRTANLLKHGSCKCLRNCYQPFTISEVASLRQAFHQLHHTEQPFLIQTMRSESKRTTYTMNGRLVCVEAFHNRIGASPE